jgi:hypothetical protein
MMVILLSLTKEQATETVLDKFPSHLNPIDLDTIICDNLVQENPGSVIEVYHPQLLKRHAYEEMLMIWTILLNWHKKKMN